jgi:hypothetical protein
MALDEKAECLYWAELGPPPEEGRGRVMSSNIQGGDQRVIVSNLFFPDVAVNPSKGLLYWTQQADSPGIWMAKLDGSGKRRIVEVDTLAQSLAVDLKDGIVFCGSTQKSEG